MRSKGIPVLFTEMPKNLNSALGLRHVKVYEACGVRSGRYTYRGKGTFGGLKR